MTTKHSPLRQLQKQSDDIAKHLKAAERGEVALKDNARSQERVTFGVVMDDKVLKIEMAWTTIKATSEAGISAYILKQMREESDAVH